MSRPTAISACSRSLSDRTHAEIPQTLADIATVSPYFTVSTGPLTEDGWMSVRRLHTDIDLLEMIVGRVQTRINAAERRVAVSTFFLGLSARLWSVGLGALAGHGVLPDLTGDQLLFSETAGQIRLHIEHPTGRHGDNLEPLLVDMVIEDHLVPLTAALRRRGPIAEGLLRGNSVSGLLSAARIFDRATATDGRGWQLARRICADERLAGAVVFVGESYRRTSCCLYYRTPGGGVCGDCVFTTKPAQR